MGGCLAGSAGIKAKLYEKNVITTFSDDSTTVAIHNSNPIILTTAEKQTIQHSKNKCFQIGNI